MEYLGIILTKTRIQHLCYLQVKSGCPLWQNVLIVSSFVKQIFEELSLVDILMTSSMCCMGWHSSTLLDTLKYSITSHLTTAATAIACHSNTDTFTETTTPKDPTLAKLCNQYFSTRKRGDVYAWYELKILKMRFWICSFGRVWIKWNKWTKINSKQVY